MTAVDWTQFPEPWRMLGADFARKMPALSNGSVPAPPRQVLGREIRQLRQDLGLTQRELARRAGCSTDCIASYERGRYRPPEAKRERLAAILLPAREVAATKR